MKLSTLNPFAWVFKPAPTQTQIVLHELAAKNRQLIDHELEKIRLEGERRILEEQFNYLQGVKA
jgi:hypothetical protein